MSAPTAPCPGCGTELEAAALSCYLCGRGRTRAEIIKGLAGQREAQAAERRRPALALALLILAGLAFVIAREALKRPAASPAAAPGAPAAPVVSGAYPAVSGRTASDAPLPPGLTQAPAAPPVPATPAPPPPVDPDAVPEGKWVIKGLVHDLFDVKPVSGAKLLFIDRAGEGRFSARTDAKGRYRLLVPASSVGYELRISHPRYKKDYIEDGDPPLRLKSAALREQAAYDAASSAVLHVPVTADPEGRRARHDVLLVPVE